MPSITEPAATSPSGSLDGVRLEALFQVLSHAETYVEIEGFKSGDAVGRYGFPFRAVAEAGGGDEAGVGHGVRGGGEGGGEGEGGSIPSSPLLQNLLVNFVLPLPGVRDLRPEFWNVRIQGLLTKLAEAGLSESYDKGAIGTRKTLATAASSIIEGVARGCLGGYPRKIGDSGLANGNGNGNGHVKGGRSLDEAWDEFLRGIIYGALIDELCGWLSETEDLEGHSVLVAEAAEYAIIYLASFTHHVFVVSSEGQYLLRLIENVHKMVPYSMMGKIFRYSNAATMLNAMVKLLLTKLSLTTLSNWAGLTQNPDEGMNLLQRIISTVLSWDASNFKKSTDKIEKSKDGPSADNLKAIKQHVQDSPQAHDRARQTSIEKAESIIATILNSVDPKLASSLTPEQHQKCLLYYSALLSARDRTEITNILCRQTPDMLTEAIREGVRAYEPIIRDIHGKIDLAEHLGTTQAFIDDFIKTSSPKKSKTNGHTNGNPHDYLLPSVEDFVDLLHRHRGAVYKWLFHVCNKCPEIRDSFRDWAKEVTKAFGRQNPKGSNETPDFLAELNSLFSVLPEQTKSTLYPILDAHATYLTTLQRLSRKRTQEISAEHQTRTYAGPGMYLASWQALLDNTLITPDSTGATRRGKDVINRTTPGKPGAAGEIVLDGTLDAREGMEEEPVGPDVSEVVNVLGGPFRTLLQGVARRAVPRE